MVCGLDEKESRLLEPRPTLIHEVGCGGWVQTLLVLCDQTLMEKLASETESAVSDGQIELESRSLGLRPTLTCEAGWAELLNGLGDRMCVETPVPDPPSEVSAAGEVAAALASVASPTDSSNHAAWHVSAAFAAQPSESHA